MRGDSRDYERYLSRNLSIIERVTDKFTGLDERLDYLNKTLERMSRQLAIAPPTVTPPITIDGRIDAIVTKLDQIVDLISRIPEAREEVMPPTVPIFWGKATGGTERTLFDRSQMWADDIWKGYEITIVKGVGIGQSRKIESNNIDTITVTDNFTTKPDHTSIYVIRRSRGVDIEAQSIGNLAVDIAAQTVSRLSVDIATQTIERLSVDIAAQSISVLSMDIFSISYTGAFNMDITAISYTGNFNINAVASQIMMPIDLQSSYIMMPIDIQGQYINLDVDIVAQAIGNLNVNLAAQTVEQLNVNLAAAAITLNVNADITAQTIGNINVDLVAQTVGNINVALVASTAVIDFNIKAQAVILNFKFSDQAKGIMLETDWATKYAYDVHLQGKIDSLAPGAESTLITLPLSTTKEHWLYTTHISGTQAGLGRVRADKTVGYDELAYGYFPAENGYIKDWLAPVKRKMDTDEGITEITAIVKNLDSALYGAFSATLDGITIIDVAAGEQLYTTQADWQACSVVYHVDLLASPGDVLLI